MKIDRLIGILSILMQRDKVTTPFLAETFEVSRRTILRDIDALCRAGIPIVTEQGAGGGVSLMESGKLNRALLSHQELSAILAGLQGLDSVSSTGQYRQLMEKLFSRDTAHSSDIPDERRHMIIDLSSWYKSSLAPKIQLIQEAIDQRKLVAFQYYSPSGQTSRKVEPCYLIFQWSTWYLYAYCRYRRDFRLFKLHRMDQLSMGESFSSDRQIPEYETQKAMLEPFSAAFSVEIRVEDSMKWRLVEEYGVNSFQEQADGSLLFCGNFADEDHLFSWLLSFDDKAELLRPESLRQAFCRRLSSIQRKYADNPGNADNAGNADNPGNAGNADNPGNPGNNKEENLGT